MKVSEAEIQRRVDQFQAAARKAGVKLTHQRLEIFRELAASQDHPSAEAVFRAVQPRLSTVSLDTVYRTLWTLEELGLIKTLGTRRESTRFDANLAPHHHYVCVECGLARDFESGALDALALPRGVQAFGSVVTTHVEVRGVCDRCRTVAKKPATENPKGPKGPNRRKR